MRITGCIMTKNEENNIKRCIDSFKNIVHEIIVVDTGSTDKTVEIAKSCGAKVYHYEWNNDFASARNVALEHATGDWIIYMDADEYFYGDTGNNIPNLLNQVIDPHINSLICKLVNIDNSDFKEKSSAHVIRIFRNSPKIRFNYKIHEIVLNDGKLMMSVIISPDSLLIYHTGYSSEIITEKLKRNLNILIYEEKRSESRPVNYFYLGDCYFGLKEYKKAINYMREYIQTGHTNIGSNMKPYSIIIESMVKLGYKYEEIMKEIDIAIKKFPNHPLLYNHKAKVENSNNKFESALKLFNKTLELHAVYNDVEINFVEGIIFDNYYNIACIYEYKNDYGNAMEYYIKSLKEKRDYAPAFAKLMRIVKDESPEDIVLLLKSVYDDKNEKDVQFLVRELSTLKIGSVLMYYTNIWFKNFKKEDSSLIFTLLCKGNYEEAYKYFSRCYFKEWSYTYALFSVIAALLSKNEKNIDEIQNSVKPSFKRFIACYLDNIDTVFIPQDKEDYLRIFKELLLLGLKEEAFKVLNMKDKFNINLSDALGNAFMDNNNYALAIENYLNCLNHTDIFNEGYICNKIAIAYYKIYDYENSIKFIEKCLDKGYRDNAIVEYLNWISQQCGNHLIKDRGHVIRERYESENLKEGDFQ